MRVFFKTLGCKVNAFDSHALHTQLQAKGFHACESWQDAQVLIINSCSVTRNAEKEALYYARKFRRALPACFIAITGCYAQTDSDFLRRYRDIDFVVPNDRKPEFVSLLIARLEQKHQHKLPPDSIAVSSNRQGHFKLAQTLTAVNMSTATRKYVKVQDGCNGFCSYCIIPYARGASVSVPVAQVLEQITTLVAQGTREIILTGVHHGDNGDDLADGMDFPALLEAIFALPNLQRLRISSLEPSELTDALLAVLERHQDKFCQHFHLPLQSGNDRILKLMRRKYQAHDYRQRLQATKQAFPQAMYGADVICGFPSESVEEHLDTVNYVQAVGLNYLHVFPYSPRPNTAALRIKEHVAPAVIKTRVQELRQVGACLQRDYYQRFFNKEVKVLWETKSHHDRGSSPLMTGYSRNYLRVSAPYRRELIQNESTLTLLPEHCDL
ncbi:MAG: tRNA (N(6)-L-threonylcarbamoyladenosine(37)-C(2))-methylthiotransferase MtaB [Pseudomonadota bacterium]|nr:tRNA (N(6)-L-threonylcarbamoyladenosine(37)-C(2))-methylthiotransferase MtaB [Pseudomonadota bacterium]